MTARVLASHFLKTVAVAILGIWSIFAAYCFPNWPPIDIRYHPAIIADVPHALLVATRPEGFLAEIQKRLLQQSERSDNCEYTVIGWIDVDTLNFQRVCGSDSQVVSYNTSSDAQVETSVTSSKDLYVQQGDAFSYVRTRSMGPLPNGIAQFTVPEHTVRRVILKGPGFYSPDGSQLAFVARHLFGPEDVAVVRILKSADAAK
jgi:hypothetical protein